jgi:hypothetical protein
MRRRFLIVVAVMFAGSVIICVAGSVLFGSALTRVDPYPAFMADYKMKGAPSYEQAKRSFSGFVAGRFPVGSDGKGAIAELTSGGFQLTATSGSSVELVWTRQAGPCSELYSVSVGTDVNGKIARIAGHLRPICF